LRSCIAILSTSEGQRWPRLLHSALLHVSTNLSVPDFAQVLSALVPSTLVGARKEELELLGEALVVHLTDAATLRSAADSDEDETRRANLCTLLAAWPPSDRVVLGLLRALGVAPTQEASCQGRDRHVGKVHSTHDVQAEVGRGALYTTICNEQALGHSLHTLVKSARFKCAGISLERLAATVKAAQAQASTNADADENGDTQLADSARMRQQAKRKRCARRVEPDEAANGQVRGAVISQEMEHRARQALDDIKQAKSLYAVAELPTLKPSCPPHVNSGGAKRR